MAQIRDIPGNPGRVATLRPVPITGRLCVRVLKLFVGEMSTRRVLNGRLSHSVVDGPRFADVDARLCGALVVARLQPNVSLASPQLLFGKLALVLLRHLRPKRRPLEPFVEALRAVTDTYCATTWLAKKWRHRLVTITLSNLNRFKKDSLKDSLVYL